MPLAARVSYGMAPRPSIARLFSEQTSQLLPEDSDKLVGEDLNACASRPEAFFMSAALHRGRRFQLPMRAAVCGSTSSEWLVLCSIGFSERLGRQIASPVPVGRGPCVPAVSGEEWSRLKAAPLERPRLLLLRLVVPSVVLTQLTLR